MIDERPIKFNVFANDVYLGNNAQVLEVDVAPVLLDGEELSPHADANTSVLCALKLQDTNCHQLVWMGRSGPIDFCGHGALAVAAYLDKRGFLADAKGASSKTTIVFPAGEYILKKFDGKYWFADSNTKQSPLITGSELAASDISELVDTDILEIASYGGQSGYLILRVQDYLNLSKITPHLDRLAALTKRALIVTSLQPENSDFDYSLRYFAPQYGVTEDSATGSANAVTALFWSERLEKQQFCCHQASARGGVIHAEFDRNLLWIGGSVRQI